MIFIAFTSCADIAQSSVVSELRPKQVALCTKCEQSTVNNLFSNMWSWRAIGKISRKKLCTILLIASLCALYYKFVLKSGSDQEAIYDVLKDLKSDMKDISAALKTLQRSVPKSKNDLSVNQPIYWLESKEEGKMRHIMQVLERIGWKRGSHEDDWRLLWTFEYPFQRFQDKLLKLKPHQKINHLPGNVVFVSKLDLASSLKTDYHPMSFQLPKDKDSFLDEVSRNPNEKWVVKSGRHRRIKVLNAKDVPDDLSGSFVQQFISNPFLIGGRKFDIGIYTVITGVDPLRVYTYEEEFLLRFCAQPYQPFNASNIQSYVVTDDYTPIWEAPVISELYSKTFLSRREAFLVHMRDHGHGSETNRIMEDMKRIIREVSLKYEDHIIATAKKYGDVRHFFELVRFDFIIDSSLKVWLMEVNMSPNMDPSHFAGNQLLYEQVLYNTFSLVGLTRAGGNDFTFNGEYESIMLVHERDLHLGLAHCYNGDCVNCDSNKFCHLCHSCQTTKEQFILKQVLLEHYGRRGFRRVFPKPVSEKQLSGIASPDDSHLSPMNTFLTQWFRGKCMQDTSWCY